MKNYHWLELWERHNIGFHLPMVNPLLKEYWPKLKIINPSHVFVPLCGKSVDLLWLANQGHHVTGVELSQVACESFFVENKLDFQTSSIGNFTCYYNEKIKLYCGDFFELSANLLPPIVAVYDRAALIALADELRKRYVNHLMQLVPTACQLLLIVYDTTDSVQGPPYPVSSKEIQELFDEQFKIDELKRIKNADFPEHLRNKGYRSTDEVIYQITKIT